MSVADALPLADLVTKSTCSEQQGSSLSHQPNQESEKVDLLEPARRMPIQVVVQGSFKFKQSMLRATTKTTLLYKNIQRLLAQWQEVVHKCRVFCGNDSNIFVYLFPCQQNISLTQIDWLLKPHCQGFVWACTLCYWYNILVWLIDALNNDRHERGLLNDSHCWPVTLLMPLIVTSL